MNEFAAVGIVGMLVGMWLGHDTPYPLNGFAIGVFLVGAVVLVLNIYLAEWLTDWLWKRRGWTEKRDE